MVGGQSEGAGKINWAWPACPLNPSLAPDYSSIWLLRVLFFQASPAVCLRQQPRPHSGAKFPGDRGGGHQRGEGGGYKASQTPGVFVPGLHMPLRHSGVLGGGSKREPGGGHQ